MSTYDDGYLRGVIDSGWKCGDCGNIYESTVTECPNALIDELTVAVYKDSLREERDQRPQGWDPQKRIFVRRCEHGVAHPDPKDPKIQRGWSWVLGKHDCDGCCRID